MLSITVSSLRKIILFYEKIKSGMNFNGGKSTRKFLSPGESNIFDESKAVSAVSYTHLVCVCVCERHTK